MDFELTEEQRAMKETARAFAREEMMPFARQWDEDEVFPVDTLREAAFTSPLTSAALPSRDSMPC